MDSSLSDTVQPTILRVIFEFYPMHGGSINLLMELTNKMKGIIHDQTIIAPNFGSRCREIDAAIELPVTRVNYPKQLEKLGELGIPILPIVLWGYASNIVKLIKYNSNKSIIIYVHGLLLGSILLFKLRSKGCVYPLVIVQDSANPYNISKSSALATRLAFILFKYFKPNYLLIGDDGMGLLDYEKILIKNKIQYEVIDVGIDFEFFSPGPRSQNKDTFFVLSTQRLDPFKRVDLGIMVFKQFLINNDYPTNVKLILIGDGSERKFIEQIIAREHLDGYVEVLGIKSRNEILYYLRDANVVIGTSLKSNVNLSIMEAMSCEKPVVVFGNEKMVSGLITNMKNGIIIKPGDINDFAEKIELIYNNPSIAYMIGKQARETIVQKKNWNIRIATELKIINMLID